MSLPLKHKNSQPAWLDVTVFAVVLAFLCFSVHVLLGFNHGSGKTGSPVVATLPVATASESRQPASQSPVSKARASTEVLRLPCLHQATNTFNSEARLMQIHAPACNEDLKHLNGWKGNNESSGEEILVFVNPKEKTLSTSYFRLQQGMNRIVFTHEQGKGRSVSQTVQVSKSGAEE